MQSIHYSTLCFCEFAHLINVFVTPETVCLVPLLCAGRTERKRNSSCLVAVSQLSLHKSQSSAFLLQLSCSKPVSFFAVQLVPHLSCFFALCWLLLFIQLQYCSEFLTEKTPGLEKLHSHPSSMLQINNIY